MSEAVAEAIVECSECGAPVSFHERTCYVCESDVGFPNVRQAETEKTDLQIRYDSAKATAATRGVSGQLDDFEKAIADTKAVLVCPVNKIIEMFQSENALYTTFGKQVRGGARIAEHNVWDKGRDAAESSLYPRYWEEIRFAALSLTSLGLKYYGKCHAELKTGVIHKRATVFEENPFKFMQRHHVIAGAEVPKGYKAVWKDRAMLAVSKLHSEISEKTKADDFQNILISNDDNADGDFIEVHVYGSIHSKAFIKVSIVENLTAREKIMIDACSDIIKNHGVELSEESIS